MGDKTLPGALVIRYGSPSQSDRVINPGPDGAAALAAATQTNPTTRKQSNAPSFAGKSLRFAGQPEIILACNIVIRVTVKS